MKRTVSLGALVLLLVLSWIAGVTQPAWADPLCSAVHGTSCVPGSGPISCITDDGFPSTCRCFQSHWLCKL